MKKIPLVILMIMVVLNMHMQLGFCQKSAKSLKKIMITTTLFPLYDFAKHIGQNKVEVFLLIPPNTEPHSYEPKPSDIIKINKSDLFIYTGRFMEPWAYDIIKGISKYVKVVDASIGITLLKMEHDHKKTIYDPHIWLDFTNAQQMIDNIAKALKEKDSMNATFYEKNAAAYKNKLSKIDIQYKKKLAHCKSKEFIYIGHYAFGYLAKRYGLTYKSIYGIVPDSEPSAKEIAKLIKQIKKDKRNYIFYEQLLSPEMANMFVKEANVKLLPLNAASTLRKKDYEHNKTYLSIMKDNLNSLIVGLECNN